MKKFFILAAMALVMNAAVAKSADDSAIDYSFKVSSYSVTRYLGLDADQAKKIEFVLDRFSEDLRRVKYTSEEKRAARFHRALSYNLSAVHQCLSDEQYRLYLTMLNTTLKTKGLDALLRQNDSASVK